MFGELSNAESNQFLKENIYGRIGCHAFGKTYVVPISYAYRDDVIYCHTFEGLKIQMMRNNPQVCFEVDKLDGMDNWKSVIAQGVFEELEGDARDKAISVLLGRTVTSNVSETVKISSQWPFPERDSENVSGIIFKIELKEISGRFEKADPQVK